ncbi:MAG: ABC transporter permease [Myxococcaceae bacterium]|nr:ABC transporter permease [Myxococcaceae bacterium]
MNAAAEWATVRVLWARDVKRFFRQRSRVVGALLQPVIFWLVIGSGFRSSFRLPGMEDLDYAQYFFPGVLAMVLLFSCIYATVTVIDDKAQGFLLAVMAGPGSRWALVMGKCAGAVSIALMQAAAFLLLLPFAGAQVAGVDWFYLVTVMLVSSLAMAAAGLTMALWLDSQPAYLALMSVVLIPAWVLSGGLFPLKGAGPVLSALMTINPMRFCVEGLRRALYGDGAALTIGSLAETRYEVWVLLWWALGFVASAAWVASDRK